MSCLDLKEMLCESGVFLFSPSELHDELITWRTAKMAQIL